MVNLRNIAHELDAVRSAGQAQAAARSALAEYDSLHTTVRAIAARANNPWEGFNWQSVDRAAARVRDAASTVQGPGGLPVRSHRSDGGPGVSTPSWAALHRAILALYGEIYAAQLFEPGFKGWGDAAAILATSIKEAPDVFVRGAAKVGTAAGKVVGGIAGGAVNLAGAALSPVKWILLGLAAVVLVGGAAYVFVGAKGLRGGA